MRNRAYACVVDISPDARVLRSGGIKKELVFLRQNAPEALVPYRQHSLEEAGGATPGFSA